MKVVTFWPQPLCKISSKWNKNCKCKHGFRDMAVMTDRQKDASDFIICPMLRYRCETDKKGHRPGLQLFFCSKPVTINGIWASQNYSIGEVAIISLSQLSKSANVKCMVTAEDYSRESGGVISTNCFMSINDWVTPLNSLAALVSWSGTHEHEIMFMLQQRKQWPTPCNIIH